MVDAVFERFVEKNPVSVMARGLLERALNPEQMDAWFDQTADCQYTKSLLFSSVFALMHDVVCGVYPAVNAAYQVSDIGVSVQALYQKLDKLEVTTSAALVRYVADMCSGFRWIEASNPRETRERRLFAQEPSRRPSYARHQSGSDAAHLYIIRLLG